MSHITIIINRSAAPSSEADHTHEPYYEYSLPVPDNATPAQVGEMVRKAYKRLEGADHDGS